MGNEESSRLRHLRGLAAAAVLIMSMILVQPIANHGSAITLNFSRPNVQIDVGRGNVSNSVPGGPEIATGIGGMLHAVWSDNRTGEYGIYYSQSTDSGKSWLSTDIRIDVPAGMDNFAPVIATDTTTGPTTGNIYVAWQRDAGNLADIYFTRSIDGGATWSTRVKIDNTPLNMGSFNPGIAVDTDSTVYVTFQDARNDGVNFDIFVTRSEDGGVSWISDRRVSFSIYSDTNPSIAAVNGILYIAWREAYSTATVLWLGSSLNKGGNWILRSFVSVTPPADIHTVSIAADLRNVIHVVWISNTATGFSSIIYSNSPDRGYNWTSFVTVNDPPGITSFTATSLTLVESSGTLYAVWADNRNGDFDIYSSWSEDDGVSWGDGVIDGEDVRVDDTDENGTPLDDGTAQLSPSAAPAPVGVYAIWSDKRNGVACHAYFSGFTLSEIKLTEMRDSPDGMEQIELYNEGGASLDLNGWGLVVDGSFHSLTSLGSIPPGEYRTVGDPVSADLQIDITMGDEGGTVLIVDNGGTVRQNISYGQLGPVQDPIRTESVARVPVGTVYSNSWIRAVTPTFGTRNGGVLPAANPALVLNEVLFYSINPSGRFIEVFFKGLGSIDLSGYELIGDSAYTLPSITLTQANPYYVIRVADAPTLFNLMGPSGDNLYLYNPGGVFMDMVGWTSSHVRDTSMSRVPDGFGTAEGYDDASSSNAGWRFGQVPSLPFVLIGPRQTGIGDLGDRVWYSLNVTNKETTDQYVNVMPQPGSQGWQVTLYEQDGITPLGDSPGDPDSTPDVGLLPPEGMAGLKAAVDIPVLPPFSDWETSSVLAVLSSNPFASASVALVTSITPYESVNLSANPSTIWVESAPPGCNPKETTLTLEITGRGTAITVPRKQDTMILMDSSGSMGGNDPGNLRLAAAKHYVDLLSVPDRAAVVDFDNDAILVGGHHLSSNYPQIKSDIDTIDSSGGTNLFDPIRIATNELVLLGNTSHVWVQILLTDGEDSTGHSNAQILAEAQRAANNNIVIFTIGLIGSGGADEVLLQQIASATGGVYLRAQTASDLDSIFLLIGQLVKNLAGYDNDVTDSTPMVNMFLPDYIHYVPGSANPVPSYLGQFGGETNLQWNISKITINETWTATLRVTSGLIGTGVLAASYPNSIVTYISYKDERIIVPMPQVLIDVLAPPPPTVTYTITRNPAFGEVQVDGLYYSVPATFTWIVGSQHTIGTTSIDIYSPRERWVFDYWDDGGVLTHNITTGGVNATITAFYYRQFAPSVDIRGLDALHSVTAYFYSMRSAVSQAGVYDTWSGWVDEFSSISFDQLGLGSRPDERWITLEDFSVAPWVNVISAFDGRVDYWHQVEPKVILQGLSSSYPMQIRYIQFNSLQTTSSHSAWKDWVDHNTTLTVGGRADISNVERFVNVPFKGADPIQWTVVGPDTYTIPFIHQFKPTVRLIGLDTNHLVHSRFTYYREAIDLPDQHGYWTEWMDEGTALSFDTLASGSGNEERWITQENFNLVPWNNVDSPFNRNVTYWHQVKPKVEIQGLPASHPVPIEFTQFGGQGAGDTHSSWSDWLDYDTQLKVGGRVIVSDVERYFNLVSKTSDTLEWVVIAPETYVVPFVHQFKPTVHLIGTDSGHTVSAMFEDSEKTQANQFRLGLEEVWSDWADEGTYVMFSNKTTGDPPYSTVDETILLVDRAFEATIVYSPPPPIQPEQNLKPLISVVFVIILLIFGLYWGNRKPWDRYIPPPKGNLKPEEILARERKLKEMTIQEKLLLFNLGELQEKFLHDRRWTMMVLVLPFATVEGIIGTASLFTGILRVPEAGNWFSIGLLVNIALLLLGIGYNLAMQRYGYKVPSEEDLAKMKEKGAVDDEVKSEESDVGDSVEPSEKQ